MLAYRPHTFGDVSVNHHFQPLLEIGYLSIYVFIYWYGIWEGSHTGRLMTFGRFMLFAACGLFAVMIDF